MTVEVENLGSASVVRTLSEGSKPTVVALSGNKILHELS